MANPLIQSTKKIDLTQKEKTESSTDGSIHSDASFLLQSDVDMIMSISGYRLVKKGALSSFQDEAGNSPPPELAIRLFEFSGSIELARIGGSLNGNATKADIDRIFKDYSSNFNPFPKQWAENASIYFRK